MEVKVPDIGANSIQLHHSSRSWKIIGSHWRQFARHRHLYLHPLAKCGTFGWSQSNCQGNILSQASWKLVWSGQKAQYSRYHQQSQCKYWFNRLCLQSFLDSIGLSLQSTYPINERKTFEGILQIFWTFSESCYNWWQWGDFEESKIHHQRSTQVFYAKYIDCGKKIHSSWMVTFATQKLFIVVYPWV